MWQALAAIGGTIYSANQAKKRAKEQMAFQERMSNSAVQRQMQDMRQAGINPILAGKYGGASSPTGAMAQTPDFGGALLKGAQIQQAVNTAKMTAEKLKQEQMNTNFYKKRKIAPIQTTSNVVNRLLAEADEGVRDKEKTDPIVNTAKVIVEELRRLRNKANMKLFLDKEKQTYKGKKYYDDAIMRGMRK
jgi:hypothetical protein